MNSADFARFDARHIPEPMSGCWLWTAGLNASGYGQMNTMKRESSALAHRIAYEHFISPIPPGLDIDHRCRVRCCVNPQHMDLVTRGENVARGLQGQRMRTACTRGHTYEAGSFWLVRHGTRNGNTYMSRVCIACNKAYKARRSAS